MNKTLVAILAIAMLPTVLAHPVPGTPNPGCDSAQADHDYAGPSELGAAGTGVGALTVTDGCVGPTTDNDFEFGNGGAFLPDSHHSNFICVNDNVLGSNVSFLVGTDGDGDGIITGSAPDALVSGTGCVTAGAAGADGGWWVFLQNPVTSGHISS